MEIKIVIVTVLVSEIKISFWTAKFWLLKSKIGWDSFYSPKVLFKDLTTSVTGRDVGHLGIQFRVRDSLELFLLFLEDDEACFQVVVATTTKASHLYKYQQNNKLSTNLPSVLLLILPTS